MCIACLLIPAEESLPQYAQVDVVENDASPHQAQVGLAIYPFDSSVYLTDDEARLLAKQLKAAAKAIPPRATG